MVVRDKVKADVDAPQRGQAHTLFHIGKLKGLGCVLRSCPAEQACPSHSMCCWCRRRFMIRRASAKQAGFDGDTAAPLITFRSQAGSVRYVWPLQQPISDLDTQRKRLKAIRQELGAQQVGCELIECYE